MKFCTKCGTQLNDNDTFCTTCGNQTSQFQNEVHNIMIKQSIYKKLKFNKLFNVFNFKNIDKKYKTIARVISTIYQILFMLVLSFAIITLILGIFSGMFFAYLLFWIICIPLCYLLLILAHIPLWKLYSFGNIYNSLCDDKINN